MDSGATQIFCTTEDCLMNSTPVEKQVCVADGRWLNATCEGQLTIEALNYTFNNVLCVPGLQQNLLSVSVLTNVGFEVSFTKNK